MSAADRFLDLVIPERRDHREWAKVLGEAQACIRMDRELIMAAQKLVAEQAAMIEAQARRIRELERGPMK